MNTSCDEAHILHCIVLHCTAADVLARYKAMHETLVYLAHLDHDDTESQMLERLRLQVGRFSWGVEIM